MQNLRQIINWFKADRDREWWLYFIIIFGCIKMNDIHKLFGFIAMGACAWMVYRSTKWDRNG